MFYLTSVSLHLPLFPVFLTLSSNYALHPNDTQSYPNFLTWSKTFKIFTLKSFVSFFTFLLCLALSLDTHWPSYPGAGTHLASEVPSQLFPDTCCLGSHYSASQGWHQILCEAHNRPHVSSGPCTSHTGALLSDPLVCVPACVCVCLWHSICFYIHYI